MRILVLSDIHANLPAFESVIREAKPFDLIWCLGDIVGYGPFPNECVQLLSEHLHICVAGNHDWAALGRLRTDDFNADAQWAVEWTQSMLNDFSRRFLETLPTRVEEGDFTIVHGSPREPVWEYILFTSMAATNFHHFQTPYCLVGHTHAPAFYREMIPGDPQSARTLVVSYERPISLKGQRMIINPGSVGQPRDGDPRAGFGILDTDVLSFTFYRVPYPVSMVQSAMRQAGFSERLIARLAYGW